MPKRNNYLTWPEYFITVAQVCALRSKDPNTQVGAVIVNNNKEILLLVIMVCREVAMMIIIPEKMIIPID